MYGRYLQSVRPFLSGRPHGWSREKHASLRLQSGMSRGVCAGTRVERWVSAQPEGAPAQCLGSYLQRNISLMSEVSPTKGPDEIWLQGPDMPPAACRRAANWTEKHCRLFVSWMSVRLRLSAKMLSAPPWKIRGIVFNAFTMTEADLTVKGLCNNYKLLWKYRRNPLSCLMVHVQVIIASLDLSGIVHSNKCINSI